MSSADFFLGSSLKNLQFWLGFAKLAPFFRSYPTFIIWQVCLLKNTTLSTNFDGKFKLTIFCLRMFLWKALNLLEWCQRRHSFLNPCFILFFLFIYCWLSLIGGSYSTLDYYPAMNSVTELAAPISCKYFLALDSVLRKQNVLFFALKWIKLKLMLL